VRKDALPNAGAERCIAWITGVTHCAISRVIKELIICLILAAAAVLMLHKAARSEA
jgi:hypothetical protein